MISGLCLVVLPFIPGLWTGAWAEQVEPKALFEKRCSRCHGLGKANRTDTADGWKALVKRMKSKGSSGISNEDAAAIIDYLSKERGRN